MIFEHLMHRLPHTLLPGPREPAGFKRDCQPPVGLVSLLASAYFTSGDFGELLLSHHKGRFLEYKAKWGEQAARAAKPTVLALANKGQSDIMRRMRLSQGLVTVCLFSMLNCVAYGYTGDIDVNYAESYYNDISEDEQSDGKMHFSVIPSF